MGQALPMKRVNFLDETGKMSQSDKRGASAAEAKWLDGMKWKSRRKRSCVKGFTIVICRLR